MVRRPPCTDAHDDGAVDAGRRAVRRSTAPSVAASLVRRLARPVSGRARSRGRRPVCGDADRSARRRSTRSTPASGMTLAASPSPSRSSPSRMCSVPMYLCFSRDRLPQRQLQHLLGPAGERDVPPAAAAQRLRAGTAAPLGSRRLASSAPGPNVSSSLARIASRSMPIASQGRRVVRRRAPVSDAAGSMPARRTLLARRDGSSPARARCAGTPLSGRAGRAAGARCRRSGG